MEWNLFCDGEARIDNNIYVSNFLFWRSAYFKVQTERAKWDEKK